MHEKMSQNGHPSLPVQGVLTQFCLDSRFVHLPGGKLSSWKFSFR